MPPLVVVLECGISASVGEYKVLSDCTRLDGSVAEATGSVSNNPGQMADAAERREENDKA